MATLASMFLAGAANYSLDPQARAPPPRSQLQGPGLNPSQALLFLLLLLLLLLLLSLLLSCFYDGQLVHLESWIAKLASARYCRV